MSIRLPSRKTVAIAFAALVVIYLLFAWLALPRILQAQAEAYIAEKAGHRLTLDRPEFNPFDLSLRIGNLRLAGPDGKALIAFRELTLDLSAASIVRRAWVFDHILLDSPEATVVLHPDSRLNWSPLIEALKSKEGKPDSPLPRLFIQNFSLAGGRIAFDDQRTAFVTRIQPLDLELHDISTMPDDKGSYKVSARTAFGARLLVHGEATLNPLSVAGKLTVEDLPLDSLAPYFKHMLPVAPPAGLAAVSSDYRLAYTSGKLDLALDNLTAKLLDARLKTGSPPGTDLTVDVIEARNGGFDLARSRFSLGSLNLKGSRVQLPRPEAGPLELLRVDSLALEDIELELAVPSISVGRIAVKDGRLSAVRDAQGRIDLVAALRASKRPAAGVTPTNPRAAAGWHYRVNKFELSKFSASLRDESVTPAVNLVLEDIALAVDGFSENLAAPLPVRASLRARDGGSLEAAGRIVPAESVVDLKLKVADLDLKPVQPYLGAQTRLTLASGLLTGEGRAIYAPRGSSFRGGVSVRDLLLNETDSGQSFLAWKSLGSPGLEVTPTKLNIPELNLDGLDTKLIISKDKSINASRMFRKKAPVASAPATADAAVAVARPLRKTTPFLVEIDRLRVRRGDLDFADLSLALPFATRIHGLRGAVVGLSSRSGSQAQVELEGQVDDYGLARAAGRIDLFDPTDFTDLKVVFRNIEMTRLTPYSATFAGRKIDSGKLSLDLEYKIKKHQLAGENQIVMDQLTLGGRVDSAAAGSLPLDLAVALLQDADGRIELGLPVSGSLDNSQFSFGGLIWKTLSNVLGRIVTAPFRALAALFGSGGEKLESIAFETGAVRLLPPEREKLTRLAGALKKRPGLSLTLHGVYADADRAPLQERQLSRIVAERAGQTLEGQERPGPLSTGSPKVQAALESLYAERIGGGQLAALKQSFRKANPDQPEQGAGGKLMSRLSGLMREESASGEQEVTHLQGADFHAILFERLTASETVTDTQFMALAKARGEHAAASLKAAGAPAERLTIGLPEKVDGHGREVALKVVLGVATVPVAPAATSK